MGEPARTEDDVRVEEVRRNVSIRQLRCCLQCTCEQSMPKVFLGKGIVQPRSSEVLSSDLHGGHYYEWQLLVRVALLLVLVRLSGQCHSPQVSSKLMSA